MTRHKGGTQFLNRPNYLFLNRTEQQASDIYHILLTTLHRAKAT